MNRPAIWRYVLASDTGLAPHILDGVCSLAVCKPMIRRYGRPGEWVMGFATAAESDGNPLVKYVMYVTDKLPFENYCRAWGGKRRDAFYRYDDDADGVWYDNGYSDHDSSKGDEERRDKGGRHVLVSTDFLHFGTKPRNLIFELMPICERKGLYADEIAHKLWHRGIGQSKYCCPNAYEVFREWIAGLRLDKAKPLHYASFPKEHAHRGLAATCR